MVRRLIYVPIIHQEVDLGSLSDELQKAYIAQYGLKKWRQHLRAVDALWQQTRERIFSLGLDFSKVKLYQDGLPAAGDPQQIIGTAADRGSQNYQLLLDLLAAGGQVVGTENPDLLLEEYHQLKNGLGRKPGVRSQRLASNHRDRLMTDRDIYIARRIDETLQEGEVGILFIGAMHQVYERLPQHIEVTYLLPELEKKSRAGGR